MVSVRDVHHFMDETAEFVNAVRHFTVPGRLSRGKFDPYHHHFLVRSQLSGEQNCRVEIIHYTSMDKEEKNADEVDADETPCCAPNLKEKLKDKAKEITHSGGTVRWEWFNFAIKDGEPKFTCGTSQEYYNLLINGKWEMVKNDQYPNDEEECEFVWTNAMGRKNEQNYNFFTNNCSHFVTELMTEKRYCPEYRRAFCSSTEASRKSANKRSSTSSPFLFRKNKKK